MGEELDAHRKRVQAQHPGLSLTALYNVLEALRAGRALTPKEQKIHDDGLGSVLRQLHDELDAAVAAAYAWPATLTDQEILQRLVALNAERAAEEKRGVVRWLRPEYQNPSGQTSQGSLAIQPSGKKTKTKVPKKAAKPAWPKGLPERVQLFEAALLSANGAITPAEVASRYARAKAEAVGEILEALCALGRAHKGKKIGTFVP